MICSILTPPALPGSIFSGRCLLPATHGLPNEEITSDLNINLGVTAHISYHAVAALALGHLCRGTPATSRKSYLVFACDVILADGIEVVYNT